MRHTPGPALRAGIVAVTAPVLAALRLIRRSGPTQVQFWLIALAVGLAAGLAALAFRKGITALEMLAYGARDPARLHSFAETLPWYWLVVVPATGGLIVGLILHWYTPDARPRSVADVIEGAATRDGRVELPAGLASVAASLITLGTGGSTGREGPVVHLAAIISSWVSDRLHADGITGRDLMGCAVAAAVSASFNAPIAGALFALEVVLRHFAVHAFAPIFIASVAGTVVGRLAFGDITEFSLPGTPELAFYIELPAFMVLGLTCGLVATVLMKAVFYADDLGTWLQAALRMPRWLRPSVAGLMLGALAVTYPHIIGVGYETTSAALTGRLLLHEAVVFALVKAFAVAITIGGRMGGGIFSPSLMLGALTGLAFGLIATAVLPNLSGAQTVYALAGMGAVAAAVLGAPISTTLIVFELTGDWQTGLAVMVAVSLSTALASRLVDRSFFLTQLERRGVPLAAGPQVYLPALLRVSAMMRRLGDPGCPALDRLDDMLGDGVAVDQATTLATALPLFDRVATPYVPVTTAVDGETRIIGALFHVDALMAVNRALAATAAEEHS